MTQKQAVQILMEEAAGLLDPDQPRNRDGTENEYLRGVYELIGRFRMATERTDKDSVELACETAVKLQMVSTEKEALEALYP